MFYTRNARQVDAVYAHTVPSKFHLSINSDMPTTLSLYKKNDFSQINTNSNITVGFSPKV
jgi:hypothetical protein